MLNGDRIQAMDRAELAEFLREFNKVCKYPKYADIEGWLDSEEPEMLYTGETVKFQGRSAIRVGKRIIFGEVYDELVQDGQLIKVPRL